MVTDETYRRWAAGLCPCCAGDIWEHYDGTQPQAIGEGVMACGRCIANDHGSIPGQPEGIVWESILEAIVRRDDEAHQIMKALANGA